MRVAGEVLMKIDELSLQTPQLPTSHHKKNGRSEAGQNCHFLLSQGQVGQVLSCITEVVGVKGGFLGWGFAVQKFRQAEW
jgi:hypothetical protein